MSDFLKTELQRRGIDVDATINKIERRIGIKEPCPSRVRVSCELRSEVLECMGEKGHEGVHYHLNILWK